MKYQKPINNVNNNDEFSSGLMEAYGRWMGGDTFQNTTISEAPFDGMDPQSNGAEIEDTTKRKKTAKKGGYVGQESAPKNEEVEVLEREEYEVDGETYVIEKVKGLDGKACWKGYKYAGTKMKGGKKVDDCVKAGFEPEGEELSEKKLDPVNHGELKGKHSERKDKDIDNDGDVDKSDKYLHMRRKKVSKIIAMKGKKWRHSNNSEKSVVVKTKHANQRRRVM